MNAKKYVNCVIICLAGAASVSCSGIVRKDAPTIAHIHIGHAITGWPAAPKKQGLLVVAELSSLTAATNAEFMLDAVRDGDLEKAKRFLTEVALAVDPAIVGSERENDYGLRRAAAEATTHLKLASDVPDATPNVQRTVTQTNIKAAEIVNRADELTVYLEAGLNSTDLGELEVIAEEITRSVKSIAGGPNNNSSYGLYDFREDIEAMVARENPPYKTVDSYYLFNLVKLPDGRWGFASRRSRGAAGAGY